MPAIQLARLRQQAAHLADLFDRPDQFCRALKDIFELYADRVHRPGQSGEPPPLIPRYNVTAPLIRHLYIELIPAANSNASHTLTLCDRLWEDPFLESRLLAASILGQAPLQSPDAILNRIERWAISSAEKLILDTLVQNGLARLRLEQPSALLQRAESWLDSGDPTLQKLGLSALIPLIADDSFENLPAIFHLLVPFIRKAPHPIKPDILNVLRSLVRRSPQETAYFLRQSLESSENSDTAWLIRQTLTQFPQGTKESLRAAMRETAK
jgi:hypothetical protein